ncbi:MAG TPA: hypothetical protein VEL47_03220 [Myxococcota bacterium]|nr:hypothetical protein [Myxococcota bacterium]
MGSSRVLALVFVVTSQVFGMDAREIVDALTTNGYVASERLHELMHCQDLVPKLIELIKEPGRLKEMGSQMKDRLDFRSALQTWHLEVENKKDSVDLDFIKLGEETELKGLPDAVRALAQRIIKYLDIGRYYAKVLLVSDLQYAERNTEVVSCWHQDKSAQAIDLTFRNQTHSYSAEYNYLFFLELDRQGFGSSELKLGFAPEKNLVKSTFNSGGNFICYEEIEKVTDIVRIKGRSGAGYFIDQDFIKDGNVVVHQSPELKKRIDNSRRYKVIMRIRKID